MLGNVESDFGQALAAVEIVGWARRSGACYKSSTWEATAERVAWQDPDSKRKEGRERGRRKKRRKPPYLVLGD